MVARVQWVARWVGLAVAALGSGVAAAQAPTVATTLDPCVSVDRVAFERLLRIELGTSVNPAGDAVSAARSTHVTIRCVSDGVELFLQDSLTRKSMTRVLAPDGLSVDTERLLALSVAEFVVASWVELSLIPEPAVEPVGPPPPPQSVQVAREIAQDKHPDGAVRAGVVLSATTWLARRQPLLMGPGIRLSQQVAGPFFWQLGACAGFGSANVTDGQVDFSGVSAFGVLGLSGAEDMLEAAFGVGMRAGYLRVSGTPERGAPVEGTVRTSEIGGPLLLTSLVLRAGSVLRLGFEVEAGFPLWPLRVRSGREVLLAFDGPWLRGGLLLGLAF